jgi:hypothetical protein
MTDLDSSSPNPNLLTFNLNICPDYILACISTDEHVRKRAHMLYDNVKPRPRGRVHVFACAFVAVLLHVIM